MIGAIIGKLPLISFFLVFLLALLPTPPAFCEKEDEHWEFRSAEAVEFDLSKKLKASLEQEQRFHQGDQYYQHSDVSLTMKTGNSFSAGAGYRQVLSRKGTTQVTERRPHITCTYFTTGPGIKFENRARMEFRNFSDGSDDYSRFRNRMKLSQNFPGRTVDIEPYLAYELFADLGGKDIHEINKKRIYVGLQGKMKNNLSLDLYYMRQFEEKNLDEGKIWKQYNTLGIKVKYSF